MSAPGPTAARHSPALLSSIAAHLDGYAVDAETFGVVLCSDADVATRYLVQLQQIDQLAQSLRETAQVLRADDPVAAIAAIRLGSLRQALEQIGTA